MPTLPVTGELKRMPGEVPAGERPAGARPHRGQGRPEGARRAEGGARRTHGHAPGKPAAGKPKSRFAPGRKKAAGKPQGRPGGSVRYGA